MEKKLSVTCECEGTGFIAVADNGGEGVEHVECKGLAEYVRGLFDDDGMAAGSGCCATKAGAALISHCDLCDELPEYEYDGKKECEKHYKQSAKQFTL